MLRKGGADKTPGGIRAAGARVSCVYTEGRHYLFQRRQNCVILTRDGRAKAQITGVDERMNKR